MTGGSCHARPERREGLKAGIPDWASQHSSHALQDNGAGNPAGAKDRLRAGRRQTFLDLPASAFLKSDEALLFP